jgi:hypothetical protein
MPSDTFSSLLTVERNRFTSAKKLSLPWSRQWAISAAEAGTRAKNVHAPALLAGENRSCHKKRLF